MDLFKLNLDSSDFTPEQREYFKSDEFKTLSPSARIAIARERLASKPTAEEVEARRLEENECLRRIYEERYQIGQNRIETMRVHLENRKKQYLG